VSDEISANTLPRGRRRKIRFRILVSFALGGILLSLGISVVSYNLTRRYLIHQRETSAVRQARANARLVRSLLRSAQPDVPRMLASLETPSTSRSLVEHDSQWYATSAVVGPDRLPSGLRTLVVDRRTPGRQRYFDGNAPTLAVGIPLSGSDSYFEVFPLVEVPRTLRTLQYSLLAAGALTFLASLALGSWAARRVLSPLHEFGAAASAIAGGQLDARLTVDGDDELVALAGGFNRMVDTLQQRIERDARFASDVSHELRSPLTTLRSAVEIMETRRDHLDGRSARALELLGEEVDRFERLVQDLLEISRYDAGVATVELEPVELDNLVRSVLDEAGSSDARIDIRKPESIHVVCDRRRVQQALRNIARNANLYAGGVRRVTIDGDSETVRIGVEDDGPGVDPVDRAAIFERFGRGRGAGRRSSGEGVGLGLALVREHLRVQGGRAYVEDGAPTGARFVLELPRRTA
jgi:signal transduction histidine kinase